MSTDDVALHELIQLQTNIEHFGMPAKYRLVFRPACDHDNRKHRDFDTGLRDCLRPYGLVIRMALPERKHSLGPRSARRRQAAINIKAHYSHHDTIKSRSQRTDETELSERSIMKVTKAGTSETTWAPPENFTGRARVEPAFSTEAPARTKGAYVTFEPAARTNWHTHPLGQTLIVTHGSGRIQSWGGKVQTINVGDVVFFEPGEKHWHGASPHSAMTHLTIGEVLENKSVDWLEPVTDEQYKG